MKRTTVPLSPAAAAFDAIAPAFDERYGPWLSVNAQRRAVRADLERAFSPGSSVVEVGGGTGEDARWLAERGRRVLTTDASPAMVRIAAEKLAGVAGSHAQVLPAEQLATLDAPPASFDGGFSNFAALNCVIDLEPVARGFSRLLRPGARLLLVLFGPLPPGEVIVQLLRGTPRQGFRRLATGDVPARLGGRHFTVRYHRPRQIVTTFAPWFRPIRRRGIGVFVPPSAAEPWISEHPSLLSLLEAADRVVSRPFALLGDHLLFDFVRRDVLLAPEAST